MLCARLAPLAALLALALALLRAPAAAQSSKGARQPGASQSVAPIASPVAQVRQQQQQVYSSNRPQAPSSASTKRRPSQPIQQQQAHGEENNTGNNLTPTEDPLSDSEPALYGSVAGAPGVDFPAYTRIPKTSFTCEGKGFDFGYYADEEAGCQVYHVCWSGRRESFLCGVGTVFNQAILACDYWHSVDCSKSSQFYGVNSELGKAGAEPTSSGSQRLQSAISSPTETGRRNQQQQQTTYSTNDDSNFDLPQAQQQQTLPNSYGNQPLATGKTTESRQPARGSSFGAYSNQRQPATTSNAFDYQQPQQRVVESTKTAIPSGQRLVPPAPVQQQQISPATTLATPTAPASAVKRPRFNMDFNQKVNSLIDSPVRPPIKTSKQGAQLKANSSPRPANFAQNAVARAQQAGSQALNPGPARKSAGSTYQQQVQVPTSTYDNELDEPQTVQQQQQQQQQSFDDAPVQTSTSSYVRQQPASTHSNGQQQLVIHAGGSGDGSSAITTQFDTLTPVSQQQQINNNQQDQTYDSAIDDSGSSSSDDFRSAGAKAAASHNQNWYIMRSI